MLQSEKNAGNNTDNLKDITDRSNFIAVTLEEALGGGDGDLSEREISKRLIEAIHIATGHQYHDSKLVPVRVVAAMIGGIWNYADYRYGGLLAELYGDPRVPLDQRDDREAMIGTLRDALAVAHPDAAATLAAVMRKTQAGKHLVLVAAVDLLRELTTARRGIDPT